MRKGLCHYVLKSEPFNPTLNKYTWTLLDMSGGTLMRARTHTQARALTHTRELPTRRAHAHEIVSGSPILSETVERWPAAPLTTTLNTNIIGRGLRLCLRGGIIGQDSCSSCHSATVTFTPMHAPSTTNKFGPRTRLRTRRYRPAARACVTGLPTCQPPGAVAPYGEG